MIEDKEDKFKIRNIFYILATFVILYFLVYYQGYTSGFESGYKKGSEKATEVIIRELNKRGLFVKPTTEKKTIEI